MLSLSDDGSLIAQNGEVSHSNNSSSNATNGLPNGLAAALAPVDSLAQPSLSPSEFHKRKVALITGITGQDGSYLADHLLALGYQVHGLIRRSASINTSRIQHLLTHPPKVTLHWGDVTDGSGLLQTVLKIQPSEIYNLAAQSHVQVSFELAQHTGEVGGLGALKVLEAVRGAQLTHHTRVYQASTSEMYGLVQEVPQRESTPFYPRSPYACAKLYAHWLVVNHRESYGMHCSSGILFNHESPRRGAEFVTRKITRAVARLARTIDTTANPGPPPLLLGNLDACRDWGHARDYVRGMHLMLQQDRPQDLVLATGRATSVKQFVEMAFAAANLPLVWSGKGPATQARHATSHQLLVQVDPALYRPAEVDHLLGDPTLAGKVLGWQPTTTLEELVTEMVMADLEAYDNGTHTLY